MGAESNERKNETRPKRKVIVLERISLQRRTFIVRVPETNFSLSKRQCRGFRRSIVIHDAVVAHFCQTLSPESLAAWPRETGSGARQEGYPARKEQRN